MNSSFAYISRPRLRRTFLRLRSVPLRVGFSAMILTTILTFADRVEAQLIGNRTVGSSIAAPQQRPGVTAGQATSSLPSMGLGTSIQSANSRFIRGNRAKQDFVGSNRSNLTGFVGSEQALGVGRVPTAAETFRLESTRSAKGNRPLPPQPAKGMYYPRLEVDFEFPDAVSDVADSKIAQEVPVNSDIQARISSVAGPNARVTRSGNTAILRGTVSSRRSAELAQQLLSFEPGIDRVKSELTVQ